MNKQLLFQFYEKKILGITSLMKKKLYNHDNI